MREHVLAFVQSVAEAFELAGPVFEFGFCPETAGLTSEILTPTGRFPETGYFGCDLDGGAEIDRIEGLELLPFADGAAGTVAAFDTLEHALEPRRAAREMVRVLAGGGTLVICSASGPPWPQHPNAYWRPTPGAMGRLLEGLEGTLVGWQGTDSAPHTVYGIGVKAPVPEDFAVRAARFLDAFQGRLGRLAAARSRGRLRRVLTSWAQSPHDRRAEREHHRAHFTLHLPASQELSHQLLAASLPEEKRGT